MLSIVISNQFKKDLKLAKKRGLKINHLKEVIDTLANSQPLNEKYRDHNLSGEYSGFRECHIEPDWLLIYRVENRELDFSYSVQVHILIYFNNNEQEFLLIFLLFLLSFQIRCIAQKVYVKCYNY